MKVYKPERSTKFQNTCISWPLASILGQFGSLSLSAINLETGISEPHHKIYHVTISYGQLTVSQWAYRFLLMHFTHKAAVIHKTMMSLCQHMCF